MNYYIWQSLLLLAVAYFLGALVGCWLRKMIKARPGEIMETVGFTPATATAAAGAAAAAAGGMVRARTLAAGSEREASIEIARPDFNLSKVGQPVTEVAIEEPDLPEVELHEPQLPEIGLPEAAVVDVELPETRLPDIHIPEVVTAATVASAGEEVEVHDVDLTVPAYPGVPDLELPAAVSATSVPVMPAAEVADDLTRIVGIGAPTAAALNKLGITRFEQIAGWGDTDIAAVSEQLGFSGRIERENWMDQARILASGNDLAFTTHQTDAVEETSEHVERSVHEASATHGTHASHAVDTAHVEHAHSEAADLTAALAAAIGLSGAAAAAKAATSHEQGSHSIETLVSTASAAVGEPADDLKMVVGIGTNLEKKLNELGVTRFAQIAAWTPEDILVMSSQLEVVGRIEREKWVQQAKALAEGGTSRGF